MLFYAGNELVEHSHRITWLPDYTGGTLRNSATDAAFGAILAGSLLLNNLLPSPQEGPLKQTLPLANWLINLIGTWLAVTVGYNWLKDAAGDVWAYLGPATVNSFDPNWTVHHHHSCLDFHNDRHRLVQTVHPKPA